MNVTSPPPTSTYSAISSWTNPRGNPEWRYCTGSWLRWHGPATTQPVDATRFAGGESLQTPETRFPRAEWTCEKYISTAFGGLLFEATNCTENNKPLLYRRVSLTVFGVILILTIVALLHYCVPFPVINIGKFAKDWMNRQSWQLS